MSKKLSRRFFLGGAGVAIGLPMLDAMIPIGRRNQAKAQGDDPTRLCFVYVSNGMIRTGITPTETGSGYTLPYQLSGLADVQGDFNVLTGLSNKPGGGYYVYPDGTESRDGPGDHARDTGTFLTATRLKKTDGTDIRNGISVDQVAANHLRMFTPAVPSLVLATREGSYGGDSGYAPIYKSNISWANETTPMAKEASARAAFERLFAGFDPTETEEQRALRMARNQSVLDYCMDDISRLRGQLGAKDGVKLDGYLSGIRQLEIKLETEDSGVICDPGEAPPDNPGWLNLVDHMFEVIKLAFQCDRTRVASLILEKPGSTYDFLSVDGSAISGYHHQMTHLEAGSADVRRVEAINKWQIDQFGSLVRRFKSVDDGDGSLLDNSLVLFGGGLDGTGHSGGDESLTPQASGPVHRHTNLPLFLAGRGRGAVTPGRHIRYTDDEPVADLYISMLQAAGVPADTFGLEGTGPLSQLG
jgi:hypothetical protein